MKINRATADDAEALSEILGEIEAYYGGQAVPGDLGQIRNALFGDHPVATVLLAREGAAVLGLASYSLLWPAAGADTSLFLKELFVIAGARRRGVARALMTALREEAAALGCSRIEWTADTDNPAALALYEALGVPQDDSKVFYRAAL
ncbi:GNAT family N-acetyltransferase [Streptomyces sp. TS71-3]|uniref:GNAT family N-acetyltransferase n=1 Tax=Streptomyces sp. TS71-3 TaxID=2733862 RepID=UPI001B086BDE|nr:GNAT family N-acetyltransferase [Streptomyces sp. TS71-3]GHJ39159.1 N-acetyltransferase [Streptomyces sp. TS71-3]